MDRTSQLSSDCQAANLNHQHGREEGNDDVAVTYIEIKPLETGENNNVLNVKSENKYCNNDSVATKLKGGFKYFKLKAPKPEIKGHDIKCTMGEDTRTVSKTSGKKFDKKNLKLISNVPSTSFQSTFIKSENFSPDIKNEIKNYKYTGYHTKSEKSSTIEIAEKADNFMETDSECHCLAELDKSEKLSPNVANVPPASDNIDSPVTATSAAEKRDCNSEEFIIRQCHVELFCMPELDKDADILTRAAIQTYEQLDAGDVCKTTVKKSEKSNLKLRSIAHNSASQSTVNRSENFRPDVQKEVTNYVCTGSYTNSSTIQITNATDNILETDLETRRLAVLLKSKPPPIVPRIPWVSDNFDSPANATSAKKGECNDEEVMIRPCHVKLFRFPELERINDADVLTLPAIQTYEKRKLGDTFQEWIILCYCNDCGKRFTHYYNSKTQQRLNSRAKSFSCNTCGKQFSDSSNFIQRLSLRSGEKTSCSESANQFNQSYRLNRNRLGHSEEKTFSCTDCGKRFSRSSDFKRHQREHSAEKPFSCSDCGKRFSQRCYLKRHQLVHSGEKPFSCSDCAKRFSQRYYLKRHQLVHIGEKPFSCSDCGKRFSQNSDLKKHHRVHSGEKPFSCSDCGKRFSQNYSLKKHRRVHSGEKPFSCSDCGKRFSKNYNLKRHHRVHSGEKPFSCSDCGKRFSQNSDLKKHHRVHFNVLKLK